MIEVLHIHSDGGSRGNPGPAAGAFVIQNPAGQTLVESGDFLGVTTNNVAEYQALLRALNKAREIGAERVECFLDSQLVVRQLNGQYKIKDPKMQALFKEIARAARVFKKISFTHVEREKNSQADELVNRTLDAHFRPDHFKPPNQNAR